MRVLYVSHASYVAAHRDKLSELAKHVRLTLVVPDRWGGAAQEVLTSQEYETLRLPTRLHGRNHFHFYAGLADAFAEGRFDLVHIDEEPYSLVTTQVLAHARRARVPAVFFAWQNIDKRIPQPFRALRGRVFQQAAGGIAGSEEAGAVLRAWGFEGPLAVIPQMGVDPTRFRPDAKARREARARLGVKEGTVLIGYAGRLLAEKGVDLLLEAVSPNTHLLILGDGPEAENLRRRANAPDVTGRATFLGSVRSLEMPGWLAALDGLVLPSRTTATWKEQFGRVLVEAMACEVAVVGSSSGEIPRVIGDAGLVFREGDASALAERLAQLADPETRAVLARKGRERALAHFTQERIVEQTLAFYGELLGQKAQRREPQRAAGVK